MRTFERAHTILAASPDEALYDAAGLAFVGLLAFSGFLLIALI